MKNWTLEDIKEFGAIVLKELMTKPSEILKRAIKNTLKLPRYDGMLSDGCFWECFVEDVQETMCI